MGYTRALPTYSQLKVLIRKRRPVDAFAHLTNGSSTDGKYPLYTMDPCPCVRELLLGRRGDVVPDAESPEVLCSFRDNVLPQLYHHATHLLLAHLKVEEHQGIPWQRLSHCGSVSLCTVLSQQQSVVNQTTQLPSLC